MEIRVQTGQGVQVIVDTDLMADQLLDGRHATDRARSALGAGDLVTAQSELIEANDHLTMLRRELEIVLRYAAEETVVVIPPLGTAPGPTTAQDPRSADSFN